MAVTPFPRAPSLQHPMHFGCCIIYPWFKQKESLVVSWLAKMVLLHVSEAHKIQTLVLTIRKGCAPMELAATQVSKNIVIGVYSFWLRQLSPNINLILENALLFIWTLVYMAKGGNIFANFTSPVNKKSCLFSWKWFFYQKHCLPHFFSKIVFKRSNWICLNRKFTSRIKLQDLLTFTLM